MQGRFKHAVPYDDAVTGQRFSKPLKRLPSAWFMNLVFMLVRRLTPSMQIGNQAAPCILSPLVTAAQVATWITCDK